MKKLIALVLLVFLVVTIHTANARVPELASAAATGNVDEVRRLIEAGADVTEKFNWGASRDLTPLFVACLLRIIASDEDREDRDVIIGLLVDAGANVNEKFEGMTILAQAIQLAQNSPGDTTLIEPLVSNGLDINAKNNFGKTALHGAAFLGKANWVEPLVGNGADLNAKDDNGYTPLLLAVLKSHKEVAEILITKGANVNAESNSGKTPLDIAMQNREKELADLIRKNGGISGK